MSKPVTCPCCKKVRVVWDGGRRSQTCRSCASDRMSGPNSPSWKGGHQQWSPGRYGKDKNGLSWKVQRRLAWERDKFECQHCGEKKNRKPDVHHIKPWMNSLSHALDNLICLCQSCHLKEEAKVQEVWGGALVVTGPSVKKPPTVHPPLLSLWRENPSKSLPLMHPRVHPGPLRRNEPSSYWSRPRHKPSQGRPCRSTFAR